MYKKLVILILCLAILALNVNAANLTDSYNWLNNQKPIDVFSSSLAYLTLKESNAGQEHLKFIESKKSSEECFPSTACKSKDTALAALVLEKDNKDIVKSLEWLKNHQQSSLTGQWFLQIDTQESGDCEVTYLNSQNIKLNVEKGFIKSPKCSNPATFFNLGSCIDSNLLSKPPVELNIKCNFDAKISSLYNDQSIYYLNDEVSSGGNALIKINSGNFENYEDTLFVNWALKELNSEINSLVYLRKNYQITDIKSNSFLYLLTQKISYANELINLQKNDGSFNNNVIDTSLALFALNDGQHQTQLDKGRKYLDSKQEKDGSWNKNILETSIVLYYAYPKETSELTSTTTEETTETENKELSKCNEDSVCGFGETALICPNDCSCGDDKCDDSESFDSCPADCEETTETEETNLCGNNELDDNEQCDGSLDEACPENCDNTCQCSETKSSFGFVKYLIILIILCVGLFFAYKKFGPSLMSLKGTKTNYQKPNFSFKDIQLSRQPERTEFKGPMNPLKSISKIDSNKKSKVEEDLERSLKEAKRYLEK